MTTKKQDTMNDADFPLVLPPAYHDVNEPPAYASRAEAGADPDEMLEPAVFVLHGRFIHPQGPSGDASSDLAYQLSSAIGDLGPATGSVDFERIDPRVRTAADGTPSVSTRAKGVYTLEYRRPMSHLGIPFTARLRAQSRKSLGEVGIEKSPVFHHGYRAVRVLSDADKAFLERKKMQAKKVHHFVIKEGRGEGWEWSDPNGRRVAAQEVSWGSGDGGGEGEGKSEGKAKAKVESEHKLAVLVPLPRRERDGLVALWCLWMWHLHLEDLKPKRTWQDRQRRPESPPWEHPRADNSHRKTDLAAPAERDWPLLLSSPLQSGCVCSIGGSIGCLDLHRYDIRCPLSRAQNEQARCRFKFLPAP